jgi:hypothetical protein
MRDGDTLVIWAINRLSTKLLDMHNLKDELDKQKCRLISCCETFDSTVNDNIFGLFGWIDSVKMSSCITSTCSIPFGIRVNQEGEYEQVPSQMETVERIKAMYFGDDDLSYSAIASELNSSGVFHPWTAEMEKKGTTKPS